MPGAVTRARPFGLVVSCAVLLGAVALSGCVKPPPAPPPPPRFVGPTGDFAWPVFTPEEEAKDVALKTLAETPLASHHLVRMLRAEKPHVHDRSDLAVFVLRGTVRMHLADRVVAVEPGDVIDVPKGTPHWAENAGPDASFAYVVFAPAFDGKDRRPVDATTTK